LRLLLLLVAAAAVAALASRFGVSHDYAHLHASLLALNDGGIINAAHLVTAVQREYRKSGGVCPLRSA